MTKTRTITLTCVYVVPFLAAGAFGVLLSSGGQPGCIGPVNAFLAPIMGPWSRFLTPNALTLGQCTFKYLLFSGVLTTSVLIFVPVSYLAKNRIFWITSLCMSMLSIAVWILYGIGRVVIDLA